VTNIDGLLQSLRINFSRCNARAFLIVIIKKIRLLVGPSFITTAFGPNYSTCHRLWNIKNGSYYSDLEKEDMASPSLCRCHPLPLRQPVLRWKLPDLPQSPILLTRTCSPDDAPLPNSAQTAWDGTLPALARRIWSPWTRVVSSITRKVMEAAGIQHPFCEAPSCSTSAWPDQVALEGTWACG
jgi:hypothetical protein